MSDHEHEVFLYQLQRKPYVGDAYLYPEGVYGMIPGQYEDFLRVICNYHTLFSAFLLDDNNSFQQLPKNALYFYVACQGGYARPVAFFTASSEKNKKCKHHLTHKSCVCRSRGATWTWTPGHARHASVLR